MNPLLLAGLILVLGWTRIFRRVIQPATSRRALGQILELLLYGDSPRLLGRVLLDLTRTSLRLGRQLLGPSLAALLLLAAVVVPLRHFVCWRPFQLGEPLLISQRYGPELEHDSGLRLDSPVLAGPDYTYYWRLVASQAGRHWVRQNDHSADAAQVWVGSYWYYLKPEQGRYQVFYPARQWWLGDHLIGWPLGLFLGCLFWLALGLVFKCCWCVLVRQEAKSPPRKS